MKKIICNSLSMFILGLFLGIISRLLDIYTTNLGNMFSELAIWILLGTLISIYSKSKKEAMLKVLLFCLGMLITYYVTAFITSGVYNKTFITGWILFAFLSPIFAYFTWMTKEQGLFPKIISVCIVLTSFASSIILFNRLRIYDFIINGILIYYLFFKKIKR